MHYLFHKCSFSAAHRYWENELSAAENFAKYGPYSRIHGHNFSVTIELKGKMDPQSGMLIDFYDIEAVMQRKIIEPFDTNFLNEAHPYFSENLPTTENLAAFFFEELKNGFPPNVNLISIEVAENKDFSSKFMPADQ